jgi:glycosyltransferase involved in cell wall biosynthesis
MTFLTIAIPTYNRVGYLKELLPRLFEQCKPYPDIEILVSNNGSTDETFLYLVFFDLEGNNPQLKYRFNETNVGGDENHVLCVESSRGEYVWVFGDDELVCDGGIDVVYKILKDHNPPLLVVGDAYSKKTPFYGPYSEYVQSSSIRDLLDQTLITCNIFKKELFNCKEAREFEHTNYGHKYTIMNSLRKGGIIERIETPIIIIRDTRAASKDNLHWIRTKQIVYLRYLGVSYPRIVVYLFSGLILPSIQRQIYNWKCRQEYKQILKDDRVL